MWFLPESGWSVKDLPSHRARLPSVDCSAVGIVVCILTTFVATDLYPAKNASQVRCGLLIGAYAAHTYRNAFFVVGCEAGQGRTWSQ